MYQNLFLFFIFGGKIGFEQKEFQKKCPWVLFFKKGLGSKNPMIFIKMHISFIKLAYSKDHIFLKEIPTW